MKISSSIAEIASAKMRERKYNEMAFEGADQKVIDVVRRYRRWIPSVNGRYFHRKMPIKRPRENLIALRDPWGNTIQLAKRSL